MKASILLASTLVLTILVLTHPALAWATDSFTIEANSAGTSDFVIGVSPNSLTINRAESKTAIVTVTSIGTFSQAIPALRAAGMPAYVTVTFTPPAPKPPAEGTANSTMTISVGADAINGTYLLTIVSFFSPGAVPKSASFTLIILPAPSVGGANVGVGFAFVGIGLGVAVAGIGVAFALSGQRGSEVIVYGGWHYCRKHRVPLLYVNGRLWCPIERRHVRMG